MVANEFVRGGDFVKNSKILGPLCLEANGLFKEVTKKKIYIFTKVLLV